MKPQTEYKINYQAFARLLGLLAAGALGARAQEAASAPAAPPPLSPPVPELTWTATPAYASTDMFRGLRRGGASAQGSIEGDAAGWAFGLWATDPLTSADKVPGQSSPEIDPYVAYTLKLAPNLTLQPGATLYTYPQATLQQGFYRSTFEPNLALNYTVAGLRLTPKLYYDTTTRTNTEELTAAFAVPLQDLGTELDFTGTYGGWVSRDAVNTRNSPSPDYRGWGSYWLAGVALPFPITRNLKLTVGWAYTRGYDTGLKQGAMAAFANPEAASRGVSTASLAFNF